MRRKKKPRMPRTGIPVIETVTETSDKDVESLSWEQIFQGLGTPKGERVLEDVLDEDYSLEGMVIGITEGCEFCQDPFCSISPCYIGD